MLVSESDKQKEMFLSPEYFAREQTHRMTAPRGRLLIAGCRAGSYLSSRIVDRYNDLLAQAGSSERIMHLENIDHRFTDSETCVRLDCNVRGCDVYIVQSLFDPTFENSIDQNYMSFFIAARAFKEHGANHVTGVLPYLAYARQDKPTNFTREPVTARLMADLAISAGMNQLIVWDPHCEQIKGFYGWIPVNALESLSLFINEFSRFKNRDDVIAVAPDAGASKFITHFGRALNIKCAIGSKYRPKPEEAVIEEIIGDFDRKKVAIVLDDMISGGGTMYGLIKKLVNEKGIEEVHLGVSHNLCVGQARERLIDLHENHGLAEVVVTNSIPQTEQFLQLPFVTVRCLSDTLARTINRIHYNMSVSEVFYRP